MTIISTNEPADADAEVGRARQHVLRMKCRVPTDKHNQDRDDGQVAPIVSGENFARADRGYEHEKRDVDQCRKKRPNHCRETHRDATGQPDGREA
jgi:hypothetical protein